jgi:hypothetical protein
MKNKNLILISLTILIIAGSCTSSKKMNQGFKPLFNGENFDGWYLKLKNDDPEMAKKVFAIEDGIIHVFDDNWPD